MAPKPPSKWLWCLFHVDSSKKYKERVQKRCVYCVIWQYCVFSQKFAATFGQELTLFCTSSVWRIFWHVNSSTNTKREFTKKDCFLCDSTLLFVFKKKVCILWAQTCSFLCTLSRLWLLFVNDSFLLLCFVLAIWKCHNFTSLHVCYLIFNYSPPPPLPQVAFASLDGNDNGTMSAVAVAPLLHTTIKSMAMANLPSCGCCSQGSWNGTW
jgi:hypothetical protein